MDAYKSPDALSLGNTCANLAASLAGGSTGIESAAGGRLLLLTFVGCQLRVLERPAPETQILGMLRVAPRPTWRDQVGQIPALLQRHAALIERIPSIVSALPAGHVALPELLIDLYAAYRIQIAESGDMARAIGLLTAEVEMLVAASDARPENVYVGDRHAAALRARASLHRSAGALREAEADLTTCSSASTIRFPSLACAEDLIAMLRAGDADAVRIAALQRRLAHLRRASLEVRVARGVNDGLSEGATISVPLTEPPPGFQGIDHLALWNQRSRGIILDRETVARLRDVHRDAASRGAVFSALATATDSTRLVFFDFGRATLTDRARQILAEVAQRADLLRPARILVVSHVDSYEADPRNRREVGATDSQISIMRAAAVASELERLGIPRSSIEVVTRGAEAPLVPTPPNTREPQNRRVEISFQ